jgi:alpha-D-xyloside xylohydrolase
MKFSHGAWLPAEGVTGHFAKRIQENAVVPGKSMTLAVVDRTGTEGVDRFEGTVLQLRITSPMADVIRVQIRHHAGARRGVSGFDLDYSAQADEAETISDDRALVFVSGALSLEIPSKAPFGMEFLAAGCPITVSNGDSLGYMEVAGRGNFLMQRLSLAVGECIYGLGERFGPLVKNGQTVVIWNEDGGTVSDLAYKNIPFYLSSRGYGLLVNTPGKVEFEIATERVSQIQFSVQDEELDYYVFHGPALKEVLDKYTRLCGRPAVPPAWSFGLWLSTSFTTRYNEQTVNEFVDGMAERGIPLKVFHFDCFWMKERHWCDFEWDTAAFPDPAGMLRRLKARGLKICLWINPYISQLSKLFIEGSEHGYFLKRPDGTVYQRDAWQPGMALVDFTNPAAVEWYCSKLQHLLDLGADCFKTDFGELIPTDVVYHDGSDPRRMHNFYSYLYNKAVFNLLEKYHGKGNAMVFARSATAGCQKFPVHWGGDCFATFESMAEDLRGGLSFCLSGPAFWSHDIGGFAGKADPALYKRWVAFGLLSTHSRLHGSESYRVPWLFDEESVTVMRFFARLKNQLFPYLFSAAHDAAARGWPVMRAMVLEFPDDPACRHLDRQYMLGSSLLVAPVFSHDNVAEYYLPEGNWTHLLTGAVVTGDRWRREVVDFMTLPLFLRENSILAMSRDEQQPRWNLGQELLLRVSEIVDGADFEIAVTGDDGKSIAGLHCGRSGATVTLSGASGARQVSVQVRRATGVTNGHIEQSSKDGVLIRWDDLARPLFIHS